VSATKVSAATAYHSATIDCDLFSTQEAFTDLALPFDDDDDDTAPTDLASMLRRFLCPEMLQGTNRYACPRCSGLRDARKVLPALLHPFPWLTVSTVIISGGGGYIATGALGAYSEEI
jgi:ubiquitin C-terminal hydrolase